MSLCTRSVSYGHFTVHLQKVPVPSCYSIRLLEVGFTDFILDDDDTVRACVRMFLELDFLEKFHINYDVSFQWHAFVECFENKIV